MVLAIELNANRVGCCWILRVAIVTLLHLDMNQIILIINVINYYETSIQRQIAY